jgi:L-rhamnonate dehydratase
MEISRRALLAQLAAALPAAETKMKITSVKAAPFRLLGTGRFGTSQFKSDYDPARWRWFGPFSQLSGSILVQIRTEQGITGYGMGGGGGAACYIIEHHLKDLLVGANPLNVEMLWDQMFSSTSFYGRKGVVIMAISGIDLALWDIAAKQAGVPVYRLLGGAVKDRVPAYLTSPDPKIGLDLGFGAFKLPVNLGPSDGEEGKKKVVGQIKQARQVIGPDALLMIDVLCRWDVPYTLEMAQRLAEFKLHFIEEPLLPDDLAGYQKLCAELTSTRIASGEHEYTHYGFDLLLRNKAAHVLQPDLTWSGGLTTGKRVATLAAAGGVPVVLHRGGSVYGIHLIMASANCPMAESFGTGEPGNELMALLTAPFENGHYKAPTGPGFGVEFPPALLRKHAPDLV